MKKMQIAVVALSALWMSRFLCVSAATAKPDKVLDLGDGEVLYGGLATGGVSVPTST